MAVALVHRRIGGEAIEITVAFSIPNPDAFAARQNHSERMIILGTKARLRRNEISVPWIHLSSLQFQAVMTWGIGPQCGFPTSHLHSTFKICQLVRKCPLIGVDRKWQAGGQSDAFDPLNGRFIAFSRNALPRQGSIP